MKNTKSTGFWLLLLFFFPLVSPLADAATSRPKLIVLMVIDQFRSDYLTRFEKRFKPALSPKGEIGGFRYFMEKGAYYPYGEYTLLQAMTGPGHATISTGAYPYQTGIPANDWYNQQTQSRMYCTEDGAHKPVGVDSLKPHAGTSPKNLLSTTIGDELKNAGYPSKVISIALKDRAAILMGGHRADLALWMDTKSFSWITSRFYLPEGELPDWVRKLNESLARKKGTTLTWEARGEGSGLSLMNPMIFPNKRNTEGIGAQFPHQAVVGDRGSASLPLGAEMVASAAESAVKEYRLGQGKGVDFLAVGFSGHDYLGHAFGPNSREMEELTVAEDRIISGFLNFLNKQVPGGLKNVAIVLTSDHGVSPNPSWLQSVRIDAGRLESEEDILNAVENHLERKFGKPNQGKWAQYMIDLNIYLNHEAVRAKGLELSQVEEEAKIALAKINGVAHVFSSTDYRMRRLPPGVVEKRILNTYFPGRSGDLVLILKPFFVEKGDTTTHVTGYTYDRMVPIVFAGFGIRPGVYSTRAEVVDIAPTLTFMSGTIPPSLSEGRVLSEALAR